MQPQYKRCSACAVDLPLAAFGMQSGGRYGRRGRCQPCERAISRERGRLRYAKIREAMRALKSGPCSDCGQTFPPFVMEFDHPESAIKTGIISGMVGGGITARVLREVAKCDLVCSNCHRVRTYTRWVTSGVTVGGRPRAPLPEMDYA